MQYQGYLNKAEKRTPAVIFSCISRNKSIHSSHLPLYYTCHGISPGITTLPPTMRLKGLSALLPGVTMSLSHPRGNPSSNSVSAESLETRKDSVVLAGVKGGDVVVLFSELVFPRLEFSRPSRVLLNTEFASVRAVLPHGNSAGVVEIRRSHIVELRVTVMTFSRGFIKRDVDTFWFTVNPITQQPVSSSTAAFRSKRSHRLTEVHTLPVVHVAPFCYTW